MLVGDGLTAGKGRQAAVRCHDRAWSLYLAPDAVFGSSLSCPRNMVRDFEVVGKGVGANIVGDEEAITPFDRSLDNSTSQVSVW